MKSIGLSRLVLASLVLGVTAHPVPIQAAEAESSPNVAQLRVPEFSDQRAITVFTEGSASAPASRVQVQSIFGLEMMYGPNGEMLDVQVDTNTLRQVLTQKLSAIGIPATSIQIISNPVGAYYGGGSVQAIFELPQPSKDLMNRVLEVAGETAKQVDNLMFQVLNMRLGANCGSLENLARSDAMNRAKQRGEAIAASMGVQLGEILFVLDASSDTQPYGAVCVSPTSTEFPAIGADGFYSSWFGYDPSFPLEVQVNNNIAVTYAIR
ncbi:MAG: SIMPL domain-containing protein [Geitlerinemataceae cyanobacterium]